MVKFLLIFVLPLFIRYSSTAQIECPEDIYFFVNNTAPGIRETFIRIGASSLEHCIKLCYGNHFCFSLIYDASQHSKECSFSYFSAYNCTYKSLVTTHSYTGGRTVLECLRCPALGDLSSTTQTAPSTEKPDEVEGSGEATTAKVQTTTVAPTTKQTTAVKETETTGVPEENTTEAKPETTQGEAETTTVVSDPCQPSPCSDNEKCVPEPKQCETAPCPQYKCENVTDAGAIEPPPTDVTKGPEPVPERVCDEEIKFSTISVPDGDRSQNPTFAGRVFGVNSTSDCARVCYERGCTVAGFVPDLPDEETPGGSCLVAFGAQPFPQVNCSDEHSFESEPNFDASSILVVCIRCGDEPLNDTSTKIDVEPEVVTKDSQTITDGPETTKVEQTTKSQPQETTQIQSETTTTTAAFPDPCVPNPCLEDQWCIPDQKECFATPCPQYKCQNDTDAAIEPPPVDVTKGPESVPERTCQGAISFSTISGDRSQNPTFSGRVFGINSTADCARVCYENACTVAGFVPDLPDEETPGGSCLVAFGTQPLPRVNCSDQESLGSDANSNSTSILLVCITCSDSAGNDTSSKLDVDPSVVTKDGQSATELPAPPSLPTPPPIPPPPLPTPPPENSTESEAVIEQNHSQAITQTAVASAAKTAETAGVIEVTPKSVTKDDQTANCIITFEVADPDPSVGVKFSSKVDVTTAQDCAAECFRQGCVTATWSANLEACLLAFDQPERCANTQRFRLFEPHHGIIWIQCIRCGDSGPVRTTTAPITTKESETSKQTTKIATATDKITTSETEIEKTTAKAEEVTNSTAQESFETTGAGLENTTDAIEVQETTGIFAETTEKSPAETTGKIGLPETTQGVAEGSQSLENSTATDIEQTTGIIAETSGKVETENTPKIEPAVEATPATKTPVDGDPTLVELGPGECLASFKVDRTTDTSNIVFNKFYELDSANSCARLCITLSCVLAEFVPSTISGQKHTCRMQLLIDAPEVCSAELETQYSLPDDERVLLSCFRCNSGVDLPVTKQPVVKTTIPKKVTNGVEADTKTTAVPEEIPQNSTEAEVQKSTVIIIKTTAFPNATETDGDDEMTNILLAENGTDISETNETQTTTTALPTTTTTLFSGPFYDCALKFQIAELYAYPLDETVNFMASQQTDTAAECAKQCFLHSCTRVGYDPLSKLCLFSNGGGIRCPQLTPVSVYGGSEQIWIHCLRCDDNVTNDQPGSIVITAEEREKAFQDKINTTTAATEPTTTAIPETSSTAQRKTTRLAETDKPEASSTVIEKQTTTVPKTDTPSTATPKEATKVAKTDKPEKPIDVATSAPGFETPRPDRISLFDGCVVVFQVNEEKTRDDGSFTRSTATLTAANCARRCYSDGCSKALFAPTTGLCLLSYRFPAPPCAQEKLVPVFRGTDLVEIHCLRCVSDVEYQVYGAELIGGSIDAPALTNTKLPLAPPTDKAIKPRPTPAPGDDCLVTFEVAEPDPTSTVKFTERVEANEAGECARMCYMHGCILAAWSPNLQVCLFAHGHRETCSETRRFHSFEAQDRQVWLQCLRCVNEFIPGTGPPIATQNVTTFTVSPETQTTLSGTESEDNSTTKENTIATQPTIENTTVTDDTNATLLNDTTIGIESTNATSTSTTTQETTTTATTKTTPKTTTITQKIVGAAGCSGSISYEVREPVMDDSEFERDITVTNAQECAKICFENGCKVVVYAPAQKQCLLYNGPNICERTMRVAKYDGTKVVRLQCIRCETDLESIDQPPESVDKTTTAAQIISTSVTEAPALNTTENISNVTETVTVENGTVVIYENDTFIGTNFTEIFTSLSTVQPETTSKNVTELEQTTVELNSTVDNDLVLIENDTAELIDAAVLTEDKNTLETKTIKTTQLLNETTTTESTRIEINGTAIGANPCVDRPCPSDLKCLPLPDMCKNGSCAYTCLDTNKACPGRLLFQILQVDILPKLNITNDVSATSPADCAQKCWQEPNCTIAGYLPNHTGTGRQGVCLLTRDTGTCLSDTPLTAQHSSATPFAISCIKCSDCDYKLRRASPTEELPLLEIQEDAESVDECAHKCHARGCSAAVFSSRSGSGNCLLSMGGERNCEETDEYAISTQGQLPLLLDCVNCGL